MFDIYSTSFSSSVFSRDDSTQSENPYGYTPTLAACFAFVILFSVSTLVHFIQAMCYRRWFLLYTVVLCGMIEILGWAGRLWSSKNVLNITPFAIQIVSTIVAPTPLLAANFVILGRIISTLGESFSRIRSRMYTKIFFTCDFVALFVQFAGGGIASGNSIKTASIGANIMLGGIVFQLGVMTCYMALGIEFFWRHSKNLPVRESRVERRHLDGRLKVLVFALSFNTICLFIRAIYRTIELADGFTGKVITTQWLFNVFDAGMVVLAIYAYNFVHPGRFLDERIHEVSADSSSMIDLRSKV